MAELMVILYPATCLTFTAIFLVFLNRESIIYGLVRCAQLIDLGNDYVELHVQTDNTEFESETELKDLEDQRKQEDQQNAQAHPTIPKRQELLHHPLLPIININRRSELPRIEPQNPAGEVLRSGNRGNLPTDPGAADTAVGSGVEDAD
ncbi:hypothetical protein BDV40DRAFT_295392 [Aspergillus tamarii]|uniref:Uncharacterized protein n=1 Tax=Aspergillus tamarii TaxID=41984 RepID=A0A5N6V9S1_ASPTM|nr:hypothetical protein BDV40DRAFT_295392 [Aspergillus tamarii]